MNFLRQPFFKKVAGMNVVYFIKIWKNFSRETFFLSINWLCRNVYYCIVLCTVIYDYFVFCKAFFRCNIWTSFNFSTKISIRVIF